MKDSTEKQVKIDLGRFWRRIWKLLEPSQKQIKRLLVLIMAMEIARLTGPFMLKLVIDKITNFDVAQLGNILILVGAMFLVNQGLSLVDYIADKRIFDVFVDFDAYLANNAHKKMVFLSLGYHEKENTGSKIIKISRGIDKIDNLFGNFFWEVAPTIFQIIFTTITLFVVNWRFGVIVLIFVPAFIFLTLRVNRLVFPFRKKRFDQQEVAASLMTQSIININTVKSFVAELREYAQFSRATKNVQNSVLQEFGKILQYNIARNLVIDLGRGFVLVFGIYLVLHGQITIGSIVFVYTISEKALLSLFRISRLYDRIMESSEAVERLYLLSKEEAEIKNTEKGIKPKNIEGRIEFKNLSFCYKDSDNRALDRASFTINSGCVVALVGPSGGGKTTVVRMIYRHYDPTEGQILLDGKDLREYDLYAFRKFMAIVPQEVEIFDTSIKENIAYAKPTASMEEVVAAARTANAEEFILQLKDGYNTTVGERGIKLSGGQRQRVGIARAILANPRILIFDEATSSLDSYSERLIQDAMDKISRNRTVIVIAHRLSTIKKADKIIVLEKGKVVEEGSHTELSRMDGGLYQKLIKLQAVGDVT
jgi:ABC-type multidrug transport system fused ATPase/permease subunit